MVVEVVEREDVDGMRRGWGELVGEGGKMGVCSVGRWWWWCWGASLVSLTKEKLEGEGGEGKSFFNF